MGSLLTNAPYWFLVILALLGLGVFVSGLKRQQDRTRTGGLILLAVAVLLFVLRLVLPTDEKKVEKQALDLIAAVSDQKWDEMNKMTHRATLSAQGATLFEGDAIAAGCQRAAREYGLTSVKVNSTEVRREPNVITVLLSVTSSHKGTYVDSVASRWGFEYQKRGDGWVLTHIQAIQIGGLGQTVSPADIFHAK